MSAGARLNVFVATKGHPFARDALEQMLRAINVEPTFVDHPAAAALMNPSGMRPYDALLLHDMPGLDFCVPVESRPARLAPPPELVAGFQALLEEGKGIVALHHAIAGWPAWPAYAEALGGAFLYRPGRVRDRDCPSSGYHPAKPYRAVAAASLHPVLAGVPASFELDDEPYLYEIFGDAIEPLLLREDASATDGFLPACHTVRNVPDSERTDWVPPEPSPVIGWAKAAGNSPLVYLQPGDGPQTFAHPVYRTLVGNALRWVASPASRAWVEARR